MKKINRSMPESIYQCTQTQGKAPRLKIYLGKQRLGKDEREKAGHSTLVISIRETYIQGMSWGKQTGSLSSLAGTKELYRVKAGNTNGYWYINASRSGNYMLDRVRTTTCSRHQHIAGGKGEVLIYMRMNISYDQTVSKWRFAKSNLCSGSGLDCETDSSHVMEWSLHSIKRQERVLWEYQKS